MEELNPVWKRFTSLWKELQLLGAEGLAKILAHSPRAHPISCTLQLSPS